MLEVAVGCHRLVYEAAQSLLPLMRYIWISLLLKRLKTSKVCFKCVPIYHNNPSPDVPVKQGCCQRSSKGAMVVKADFVLSERCHCASCRACLGKRCNLNSSRHFHAYTCFCDSNVLLGLQKFKSDNMFASPVMSRWVLWMNSIIEPQSSLLTSVIGCTQSQIINIYAFSLWDGFGSA